MAEAETEPERVGGEGGSLREGLGEGVRQMREDVSRDKIEGRLDDAVSDRPLVRHLLDLRIVVKALLIAAVLTLIVSLLLSPKLGALVLVVAFGAAWFIMANKQYNRRRPTKPAGEDDDSSD
jgi:Flp pilus assembly protein TadB